MKNKIAERLKKQPKSVFQKLYSSILEDSQKGYLAKQTVFNDLIEVLESFKTLEEFEANYLTGNLSAEFFEIVNYYIQLKDCYSYILKIINNCCYEQCNDSTCDILYFKSFIQTYGIETFEISFWNYDLMINSLFSKKLHNFLNTIKRF